MHIIYKSILFLIFISQLNLGQNNKVYGVIKSEELLNNVTVKIENLGINTSSNIMGEYFIQNIPSGQYQIEFSYVGYKSKIENINIEENQQFELNILLEKKIIQISEVQIVSSRSEKIVRELPLPVEYVSKTKIDNSSSNTLSDLLNRESGLSIVRDGPWATTINVRGLGKQNLVYLIDGNRIETSTNIAAGLSLIDMNDIESVEVIKSGLSSLYGTGATGGIINIKTKGAEISDHSFFSSQLINNLNSVNNSYSTYLNVKAGNNKWAAKINGSFRKADDIKTPSGLLNNSAFRDESLSASLKYHLLNDMSINLDYQKFAGYDVGIPGGDPFPQNAVAKYKYANRELFSISLEYKNISNSLLKTNVKYYNQLICRSVELKPNPIVTSNPKADHLTNGILFQTDWYVTNNNFLIAGIDFWQREYDGTRKVTNLAQNIISVDKPVPNSRFRSLGIFAKNEMSFLNNKLNLAISGRYDFINISNEETKNPVYRIVNGIKNDEVRNELASYDAYNEENKSVSGGIGVVYNFYKEFDLSFNIGYNFRSPSLEERYQFIDLGGIVYLGNPKLNPEEGWFLDGGFRVWNDDITFRLNTFSNTFSNLVIDDVLINDSIYMKQNVGKAHLFGFDSRIDYNFYRDYLLYLNAAYVIGKDLTNNTNLPQISPFNALVGLVFPIYNYVKIDLSATISANQNRIGLGERKTSGFTYYDLSIISNQFNLGFTSFNIVCGIQNIFNKEYREHLSTYRGLNNIEPGRNIFVKFIFNFE